MANKEWQKISYNQSYWAEIDTLAEKWEKLMAERPIDAENYQPVQNSEEHENPKGSDIY